MLNFAHKIFGMLENIQLNQLFMFIFSNFHYTIFCGEYTRTLNWLF